MAIKLNDSYGKTQIMKNEKILKEKELISQRNAEIRAIQFKGSNSRSDSVGESDNDLRDEMLKGSKSVTNRGSNSLTL